MNNNLDVLFVNNWGSNPNDRTYHLSNFLDNRGLDTFSIGRRNKIIPIKKNSLLLNVPLNKDCNFLRSTILANIVRIIILLFATKKIFELKPRYVYTRDLYFSMYFNLLARILDIKVIFESHGFSYKELDFKKSYFKKYFVRRLEDYNIRLSELIICITNKLKNTINDIFKDKEILVIPNGVSNDEINFFLKNNSLKGLTYVNKNIKVVGFVGNWENWIQLEDFLDAYKYVKTKTLFFVIGEGKNYNVFKNSYKNIIFKGLVPKKIAWKYITFFDICVSPWSDKAMFAEKSARKTFEYLNFGKPIITSDVLGREPFLTSNINCLLYESGNPSNLAEKIDLLFNNKKLFNNLKKNNTKLGLDFDYNNIFTKSSIVDFLKNK